MEYIGPDFYNISDLLTEEELLIQKTAHDFVNNEFKPIINEHYENGTFPIEIATKLGELGFMGSSLPEESGGAGVSGVAYGLILHELEKVYQSASVHEKSEEFLDKRTRHFVEVFVQLLLLGFL